MYMVISFNYKNSNVEERGKLSTLVNHYDDFKNYGEVIIVATCNRIEIAAFTTLKNPLLTKIEQITGINTNKAFIFEGVKAIEHIFRVLSSLDSMVVGETQITGQYKEAFMKAYEEGAVKKNLSRVMHHGFKCAKRVRNETNISSNPVSVASIAVKKAKEVLGNLGGYTAVVIGAGDTSRIICKHLEKAGVNIILLNRTYENAVLLKEEIKDVNVDIHSIDKLSKFINSYRLLFTATSSKVSLIKEDMVEEKDFNRYWFDLAVPSDICEIKNDKISVFRVDDLKDISDENIKQREKEIKKANELIEEEVEKYLKFLQESEITPIIKSIRKQAELISKDVIANAVKKHFIKPEDEDEVTKIVYTAFKRFLHNPTITLKENANEPQIDVLLSSIKKLFKLDENLVDMNKCEYHSEIKKD
jgi:glutamyl-tRNA reductase